MKHRLFLVLGFCFALTACNLNTPTTSLESQAGTWQRIGGAVILGDTVPKLALDSAANPYVAWYEVGGRERAFVKTWNGASWTLLGSKLNVSADSFIRDIDIEIASNGRPVVAWMEFSRSAGLSIVYVKRWTGSDWTRVGSALGLTGIGISVELELINDEPVVAYQEGGGSGSISVKRWAGSSLTWLPYGAPLSCITFSFELDKTNSPVVACEQSASSLVSVVVYRWQTSTWALLGGSLNFKQDSGTKPPALVVDSQNRPVVAWIEFASFATNAYAVYVKRWDGSSWVRLGNFVTNDDYFSVEIVVDNTDAPVVAWTDQANKALFISRWSGSSWRPVGKNPVSNIGGYATNVYTPSIAWGNNNLVAAWRRLSASIGGTIYNGGIFAKRYVP